MTRAVIAREAGAPVEIVEVGLPALGPRDVQIRLGAAGVCHSDLSMLNGTIVPRYPLVLGHEAAGVISHRGSEIDDLGVGERVILNWAAPCRTCWFCLNREPWLCSRVEGVVSRPLGELDGAPLQRALGIGAFCEEIVVPRSAVVPMPAGVSMGDAALMGCAVLTGTGAVWNTAQVQPGQSVCVIGLGGIGLSVVAGASLAGAADIIAVDRSADKESLATAMGATTFLVSQPTTGKDVRALSGGRGVDHAFECVGAATTIRLAWQSTRRGGQCVVVGVGPREAEVSFNAMELYHFNRTLTSSIYGSCDPERDIPVLAAHVASGRLDLGPLVTHRIDLDGVPDAFRRMQDGRGARSLIEFGS